MTSAEQLYSEPSWPAMRAMAAVTRESRRFKTGLRLFAVHLAGYVVTLIGAIAPLPLALNLVFAVANGFFIALLFIMGHDCGHSSFIPGIAPNRWLGRIVFLPSAHGLSLWRNVHNEHHHAATNLKGVDGVWVPMSPDEYRRAPSWRRWLERICRSPAGPLIYYYVEFWPHRMLFPLAPELRKEWRRHVKDSIFASAGFALIVTVIMFAGKIFAPERSWLEIFVVGWAIPFAVWNYLMAFTIYINHTHPAIPWFDDQEKWRKYRSMAPHTASVIMPINFAPLYTKVLAHTSHHIQTGVPAYALPEADKALRTGYAHMLEYRLIPRSYLEICRTCKLFDYESMCWTDFSGRPTTQRLIPLGA